MNFIKSIYDDNELYNVGIRKRLDVFCDNNRDFFYKMFYNVINLKRNNLSGLAYSFNYIFEDVKYYKKKYRGILFDNKSGVSLYDFCEYYKVDVKIIKDLLNKKYLTYSEYTLLRKFVHKEDVNKYFEILKKYNNKKMLVSCSNIFANQEGLPRKKIVYKEKYQNKSVTFTTEKDYENFENIKQNFRVLKI